MSTITIPKEFAWCVLAVGAACFTHLYGSFKVRPFEALKENLFLPHPSSASLFDLASLLTIPPRLLLPSLQVGAARKVRGLRTCVVGDVQHPDQRDVIRVMKRKRVCAL
jgi:hypothetical protein